MQIFIITRWVKLEYIHYTVKRSSEHKGQHMVIILNLEDQLVNYIVNHRTTSSCYHLQQQAITLDYLRTKSQNHHLSYLNN